MRYPIIWLFLLDIFFSQYGFATVGIKRPIRLWRDGTIQYSMEENCDAQTKTLVRTAMDTWQKAVGRNIIRFVEDSNFANRLRVDCTRPEREFAAGEAPVGYSHMEAFMRLNPKSHNIYGTILHELGHVLGLEHEQKHPKAKNNIDVNRSNILEECLEQYHVLDEDSFFGEISAFDFNSIMLYDSHACAKNKGIATATTLTGSTFTANRSEPSLGDIAAVRSIFTNLLLTPAKKTDFVLQALNVVNRELINCKVEMDGEPVSADWDSRGGRVADEESAFAIKLRVKNLRSGQVVRSKGDVRIDAGQDLSLLRHDVLLSMEDVFQRTSCLGHPDAREQMTGVAIKTNSYMENGCRVAIKGIPYRDGEIIVGVMQADGEKCPNQYQQGQYFNIPSGASQRLVASHMAYLYQNFGGTGARPGKRDDTDQIPYTPLVMNALQPPRDITLFAPTPGTSISGYVSCQHNAFRNFSAKEHYVSFETNNGDRKIVPCHGDQVIPPMVAPVRVILSQKLKEGAFNSLMLTHLHVVGSNEKVTNDFKNE